MLTVALGRAWRGAGGSQPGRDRSGARLAPRPHPGRRGPGRGRRRGLLGWLIARQVTRRLVRLTGAAEQVAATGRLDVAVPVEGTDEAGRLGAAFNEMLAALARSKDDQQRLVQDAGHELRTPLTSLRTNISVLRRYDRPRPRHDGRGPRRPRRRDSRADRPGQRARRAGDRPPERRTTLGALARRAGRTGGGARCPTDRPPSGGRRRHAAW